MKVLKVSSFTLSELLVVMAVSGILVTGAFYALNSVQKQVENLQKMFELEQKIYVLERQFFKEFQSKSIYYNTDDNTLRIEDPNHKNVEYKFRSGYLLRNADTLGIQMKVNAVYEKGNIKKEGVIDAIDLQVEGVYNPNRLFISKRNDAAFYMNK